MPSWHQDTRYEWSRDPDRSTFIIQGTTLNGSSFRSSDWAGRLSGAMSTFGCNHRMSYFPYVRPLSVNGIKSVSIDKKLRK